MRITKNGHEIRTVDDWFQYAPPMGRQIQWRDGRSAKELAKAWCSGLEPTVPTELVQLLRTTTVSVAS